MSLIERLNRAWVKKSPSSIPLPDLPHLVAVDDDTVEEQLRKEVTRTIVECEATVDDLERQLEQRRFIVSFLREFLDRPAESRDQAPVAPVRLRRRARQNQLQAQPQIIQQVNYLVICVCFNKYSIYSVYLVRLPFPQEKL